MTGRESIPTPRMDSAAGKVRAVDTFQLALPWIVIVTVVITAFYPGVMSNDSEASLKQARSLEFTSWHPPIMALVWGVLDRLVEGPALMLVAQAALYATATTRICAEALPATMQRFGAWLVVPLFALFPPAMALNGMIWKDVWMSSFLLLALADLFRLAGLVGDRGGRLRTLARLVLYCLLATAFRHNAIAATAGLLAGGIYFCIPGRRVSRHLLTACVSGVLLAGALMLAVNVATRVIATQAHVTTPILMHDIAGIIVESGEPDVAAEHALTIAPALNDADRKTFVRRIERTYDAAAAGRVLRTSRKPEAPFAINVYQIDHDADSVKRAWKGMITRYPGAYLKHRAHAFACLLQLCDADAWAYHSYVLNQRYVSAEQAPAPQSWLRATLLSPSLVRVYAPAFWLALAILGGVIGLIHIRSRSGTLLFMGLSAVGSSVALYFFSPIESYRYMHWVILCGWMTVWLYLEARQRR